MDALDEVQVLEVLELFPEPFLKMNAKLSRFDETIQVRQLERVHDRRRPEAAFERYIFDQGAPRD